MMKLSKQTPGKTRRRAKKEIVAEMKKIAGNLAPIYYLPGRDMYLKEDNRGEFIEHSQGNISRHLRRAGVGKIKADGENLSPLEEMLCQIQDSSSVVYAAPYAGHKKGLYEVGGNRILATNSPKLIAPQSGDFPVLVGIINGLFCNDSAEGLEHTIQRDLVLAWLADAYRCIDTGKHHPGLVLCIAGPPRTGKSLFQSIITAVLGGRVAKPFGWLEGKTDFNRDQFAAEHLAIGDEAYASDMKTRLKIGAGLKIMSAERDHRCHGKMRDGFIMRPFWRVSWTCNDEPERLMALPPINEDIADKILLLKAGFARLKPEHLDDGDLLWNAIVAELPAFIDHVLKVDHAPEEYRGGRFGVKHYHNPDLLRSVHELSAEASLLGLIDQYGMTEWKGTTAELKKKLEADDSPVMRQAQTLLHFSSNCGKYMARLARTNPERVAELPPLNGYTRWQIKPRPVESRS